MSTSPHQNPSPLRRAARRLAALAGTALALFCALESTWAHGALHERIATVSEALARQPEDPQLHFQLAELNCQHGDWDIALLNLTRVDQLAPGRFPTDLVRGRALLAGGKPGAARKALDRFLAAHPDNPGALVLRARASKAMQDTNASIADLRAALEGTRNPEPDLVQETADALAANGDVAGAVKVLDSAMAKAGAIPSLVLRAVELEIARDRLDAALSRVEAMQKDAPRPEPWMAERARILSRAGRLDETRAAWKALLGHLTTLPDLERGSHAMSRLAEEAHRALKPLSQTSADSTPPPQ